MCKRDDCLNKENTILIFITGIITYILVHLVYLFTGFSYKINEGILNIKLLFDISLWLIIYFLIYIILKKLSSLTNNKK